MTDIPDRFQVRVAQIALSVAQRHGFALGGGHALLAHGLVHRPTEDIDSAAPGSNDLSEVIHGMDDAIEELVVSDGSATASVSLARLARHRTPIVMAIGPVLHIDDLLGSKVSALGTRAMVRDFIDVAAALGHGYPRNRLIEMAHEHDPDLNDEDLGFAMRRLDAMPDSVFAPYGLDAAAINDVRIRFADWPRS